MKPGGYSRAQIVLHWIVFLLVVQQFVFSEYIEEAWEKIAEGAEMQFSPLIALHVFGGILIALLVVWRLMLRARRGVPASPGAETPAQKAIAHGTHHALYLLLILMPVSGAAAWFLGLEPAATAHGYAKVAVIVLVLLHVIGALHHQFILRDNLLDRMKTPRD